MTNRYGIPIPAPQDDFMEGMAKSGQQRLKMQREGEERARLAKAQILEARKIWEANSLPSEEIPPVVETEVTTASQTEAPRQGEGNV